MWEPGRHLVPGPQEQTQLPGEKGQGSSPALIVA